MSAKNVITKEECILLNEILGTKTPAGCYSYSRTDFDDKFTVPGQDNAFTGKDEDKHRNSWLMPRMARRMTRHNKHHVSQWRKDVEVDRTECKKIEEQLFKAMGAEGKDHLPKACQRL